VLDAGSESITKSATAAYRQLHGVRGGWLGRVRRRVLGLSGESPGLTQQLAELSPVAKACAEASHRFDVLSETSETSPTLRESFAEGLSFDRLRRVIDTTAERRAVARLKRTLEECASELEDALGRGSEAIANHRHRLGKAVQDAGEGLAGIEPPRPDDPPNPELSPKAYRRVRREVLAQRKAWHREQRERWKEIESRSIEAVDHLDRIEDLHQGLSNVVAMGGVALDALLARHRGSSAAADRARSEISEAAWRSQGDHLAAAIDGALRTALGAS